MKTQKLNASDLQIRDWVQVIRPLRPKKCVARVTATDEDGIWIRKNKLEWFIHNNEFFPIPITPEILEKNGWRFDDLCSEWYIPIGLTLFGRLPSLSVFDGVEICYVHELQHALKLYGIDKEITL